MFIYTHICVCVRVRIYSICNIYTPNGNVNANNNDQPVGLGFLNDNFRPASLGHTPAAVDELPQ